MWLQTFRIPVEYSFRLIKIFSSSGDPESADASPFVTSEKGAAAAKDKYAHTLFYLAQIFAKIDDPVLGAFYCGETLALQLEMGEYPDSKTNAHSHQMLILP